MTERWYGISSIQRPNVDVTVLWEGRQFRAAIILNPATKRYQWATVSKDGDRVFLPPKGLEKKWGDEPEAWRPIGAWPDPLPEPLRGVEPRLYSSTMKFQLVEDATSADLAREMEQDRADAQRGDVSSADRFDPLHLQWWRDNTKIKYEARGQVTKDNCEGRLMRYVACFVAPFDEGEELTLRTMTTSQILVRLIEQANKGDATEVASSSYAPRLFPIKPDHDDFLEAARWYTRLNPVETWGENRRLWKRNKAQQVLAFRAKRVPWSYAEIGEKVIGKSGERARQIYSETIKRALAIANAPEVVDPRFEELRERNRAFRRAG